jgi:hypothetical protein
LDFLIFFEEKQSWNLFQMVLFANISVSFFIHVDLDNMPGPFALLLFFVQYRSQHFAGVTPGGAELNNIIFLSYGSLLELSHVFNFSVEPSQKSKVSPKHFIFVIIM